MLLQASKLDLLPKTQPDPSLLPSSLLFEPFSQSLALMLSDSSFLLFPSFSPFSTSPTSPTSIPPISTSACFLRLLPNPSPDSGRVLFLSASPLSAGSAVLLRAWILRRRPSSSLFSPALLNFKNDTNKSALALNLPHGFSVRIDGSVNVLVLHSLAANQIWILAARLGGEDDGMVKVDLVKCAVIDCVIPIYSIGVSMGFMVLGEVDGVRVFPLRPLIKGRAVKHKGSGYRRHSVDLAVDSCKKKSVPNGVMIPLSRAKRGPVVDPWNGKGSGLEGVVEGRDDGLGASCKLRTLKLRQNSGDFCSFFVVMRCAEVQNSESGTSALESVKAVSIHLLSQKKFLIMDSVGNLHLLSLHNTVMASEATAHSSITSKHAHINLLGLTMKVQTLAVLPDISARMQVLWLSDGAHSVHMIPMADVESPVRENEKDESNEKAMQISAIQAIFTSEKVQDIVAISPNAILILGQGNIFAYAIA